MTLPDRERIGDFDLQDLLKRDIQSIVQELAELIGEEATKDFLKQLEY